MFHEMNFSPFATNVIDCTARTDLCTPDGIGVKIEQDFAGLFTVTLGEGDKAVRHDNLTNLRASYLLNSFQVGYRDKREERVR